jgi:hypothetical protein
MCGTCAKWFAKLVVAHVLTDHSSFSVLQVFQGCASLRRVPSISMVRSANIATCNVRSRIRSVCARWSMVLIAVVAVGFVNVFVSMTPYVKGLASLRILYNFLQVSAFNVVTRLT